MGQKFYTSVDRYVNGHYVKATPEYPVLVEFSDDAEVNPKDLSLKAFEDVPKGVEPFEEQKQAKPHFAKIRRGPPPPARSRDKAKRASDVDPGETPNQSK